MAVLHITQDNMDETIKNGVSLIDVWADWCMPCKLIAPIIDELAEKYEEENVKICKLNLDEAEDLATELGIMAIPTVLCCKDGEVVDNLVGVQPIEAYETWIENHS